MKKLTLWLAVAVILLIPAIQWSGNVFITDHLVSYRLPPGQWFYLLSKLTAQYAFLFLTVQLVFGLVLAVRPNALPWLTTKLHRTIGLTVLGTILLHAGLFVSAVGVRSGHFPATLLTINLDQGFYNLYVSFGLIAAGLLVIVALLGILRRFLSLILFRSAHRLAWLVWVFGFAHSYAIGTETGGWVIWSWFYWFAGAVIGSLLLVRIILMTTQIEFLSANKYIK